MGMFLNLEVLDILFEISLVKLSNNADEIINSQKPWLTH